MPGIDANTARYERKEIMKRTALRVRNIPAARIDTGKDALWSDLAGTFDDRVSETLVDYEDEREAVEAVAQRAMRSVN